MAKTAEYTATFYDGQKFIDLGSFSSLEAAQATREEYVHQQTFEDIEEGEDSTPYLHLMEFREGRHYYDMYFTLTEFF